MIDPLSLLAGFIIGLLVFGMTAKRAPKTSQNPSTLHKIEKPEDGARWTP